MSHHFDTPTAREDPRICVNDFYLFDGAAGTTVMAMTVNADAGLSAPDTFRDEGLYAFRFDLNGDAREELTFKFRFGDSRHADGIEHRHVQDCQVRMASGEDALHGVPIAREQKTTNLDPSPEICAVWLLETRLQRLDSRKSTRDRVSKIEIPRSLQIAT